MNHSMYSGGENFRGQPIFWHSSFPDDDLSNTKNKLWNGTGREVEPGDDINDLLLP